MSYIPPFVWYGCNMPDRESMLTAVEAAIEARLTGGAVASFAIGARNTSYMSLNELRTFRRELLDEISAGRSGGRGNVGRFRSPT